LSADVHRSGLAGERARSRTQLTIKASCRRRPQRQAAARAPASRAAQQAGRLKIRMTLRKNEPLYSSRV
jgi:hypothetical protein